jgi:hypothetical protein
LPATFGYVAPDGGFSWQEVQLSDVSGELVWWHTVQVGPSFVADPVSKWQYPQLVAKLDDVTEVWFAPVKGTEWLAPPDQEKLTWTTVWQAKVPQVWFAAT